MKAHHHVHILLDKRFIYIQPQGIHFFCIPECFSSSFCHKVLKNQCISSVLYGALGHIIQTTACCYSTFSARPKLQAHFDKMNAIIGFQTTVPRDDTSSNICDRL